MRVLMTTDTVGGVWTFTQDLVRGLLQRDCAVALASFGRLPSKPQSGWLQAMQARWGKNFCYQNSEVPLEWMEQNQNAYSSAAPLLIELSQEFAADIFHSNQFCFGALPLKIPKVITAHSDVLSWAECCRNGCLEESAWLKQYCYLVSRGVSRADLVIAPTNWMAQALARNFGVEQIATIPNGRSLYLAKDVPKKLQAVTAGRPWDDAKNISLLQEVHPPMSLLVAGEKEYANRRVADGGEVEFVGSLLQEELLNLFLESAVYICTSRYEPFGLAPLEAALCGCAILANDIPSLREVWGKDALYFHDADSLEKLLHELADNPELLASAQERSNFRARFYSAERMTDKYVAIFSQALMKMGAIAYAS